MDFGKESKKFSESILQFEERLELMARRTLNNTKKVDPDARAIAFAEMLEDLEFLKEEFEGHMKFFYQKILDLESGL